MAGEFARMLITKLRERDLKQDEKKLVVLTEEDEKNILCIQIAGLCHDLGNVL